MVLRKSIVLSLAVIGLVLVTACSQLNRQANPTPTLPALSAVTLPAPTPTVGELNPRVLASISGNLFHDKCEAGQPGQPAPKTPPPGCISSPLGGYRANGIFDAGEPTIASVHVTISTGACPGALIGETVTTSSNPAFTFSGLNAGTYCVAIDPLQEANKTVLLPGAWTLPAAKDGALGQTINIQTGEQKKNVDFGWDYQLRPATSGTPVSTPVVIASPTPHGDGACTYRASFVADVNYPDNTVVAPGTAFIKTWRVQNTGTCSWGKAGFALHSAVFVGGDKIGAPDSVELLPDQVNRGQSVDISVPFVAPNTPGTYKSQWRLKVDNGPLVGVDAQNVPIFAVIVVSGSSTGSSRITFAADATDETVSGNLNANQIKQYVIRILQDQTVILNLSSASSTARIQVIGTQGASPNVIRSAPESGFWLGTIPVTGDYILQISAGTQGGNYSLNVSVPRRLTFAPGAISLAVNGSTASRRIVTYLLRASAGQLMAVNLVAPLNTSGITIYGLADGSPLVNANMSGATSWTGNLPGTQDYVIQVVPAVDGAFSYTLQVTVQ
ncbi:MAG TPA: NBR1-Ig-like domain-containing protein [Anaerolineae bacterium]